MKQRDQDLLNIFIKDYKKRTNGRDLKDDLNQFSDQIKDPKYWLFVVCSYFNITSEEIFDQNKGKEKNVRCWYYYLCIINGISSPEASQLVGRSRDCANQNARRFKIKIKNDKSLIDIRIKLLNYPVPGHVKKESAVLEDQLLYEKYSSVVCNYFGITKEDLEGTNKKRNKYSPARIWVYYFLHKEGIPAKRIGELMGRAHGTILRTLPKHEGKMLKDDDTKIIYMKLIHNKTK